eukprot:TRINITY_DN54394_c0_g2_i1.p1 TRINITY_DN54394_c0_g2~~TRINITY_DN54394_c0_g2_i1.p1  ORF type:complete len:529 (+),score=12.23 TRINITY_DN54394_c0_g2_i1:2-1588(+)
MGLGVTTKWLSAVESTGWFDHVQVVLSTARIAANALDKEKLSVLVHCSDGWDRTSQVVTLAQLLLDPYFRTIEGFAALIEKDWLSFGHRFRHRVGHGMHDFWEKTERGPIFVLWMDCVHQLVYQFPTYFEFDDSLLLFVLEHLYSCRFGTFLHDSDRERHYDVPHVRECTPSIWTYILTHRKSFINPYYERDEGTPIWPSCLHSSLHFWSSYYLRYAKLDRTNPDHESVITGKHMHALLSLENSVEKNRRLQTSYKALLAKYKKQRLELQNLQIRCGLKPSAVDGEDEEDDVLEEAAHEDITTSTAVSPPQHCRAQGDDFLHLTLRASSMNDLSRMSKNISNIQNSSPTTAPPVTYLHSNHTSEYPIQPVRPKSRHSGKTAVESDDDTYEAYVIGQQVPPTNAPATPPNTLDTGGTPAAEDHTAEDAGYSSDCSSELERPASPLPYRSTKTPAPDAHPTAEEDAHHPWVMESGVGSPIIPTSAFQLSGSMSFDSLPNSSGSSGEPAARNESMHFTRNGPVGSTFWKRP